MIKKIVIAGGNGFLGSLLSKYFRNKAEQIIVLARTKIATNNVTYQYWDGEHMGEWVKALEGADVLINFAGKSVNCRYTEENKKLILDSRLKSTRILGQAVQQCANPPKCWINASSATIYRASYEELMTESNGEIGEDFSMDVCKQWESCFQECKLHATRKVTLRIAIVLGRSGGALPVLINLVKSGMGGAQGDGKQYCSWIHQNDFCSAVEYVINNEQASGVYNVAAPVPLTNKAFMQALRDAVKMPLGIHMSEWLLKVGAIFIGTEAELVLKSRKVYPKRLLDEGFVFEFADVNAAFSDLCRIEERKN